MGTTQKIDSGTIVGYFLRRKRPDIVFHCAGTPAPGPWKRLVSAHVTSTKALLEGVHLSRHPVRVVILGSAAEYGVGRRGQRFSERSKPSPHSLYGKSKWLQTTLARRYAQKGLDVVVARLFNVLTLEGPATMALPRVAGLLKKKSPGGKRTIEVGPISAVRDYISLEDALEGVVRVGLKGRSGEIYNLCSGQGVSMEEMFNALAEGAQVKVTWKVADFGSKRSNTNWSVGNNTKSQKELGWLAKRSVLDLARRLMRKK